MNRLAVISGIAAAGAGALDAASEAWGAAGHAQLSRIEAKKLRASRQKKKAARAARRRNRR